MTAGPDLTYNGDYSDTFVAKVNAAGTALLYCGFIGGSAWDGGYGIAVDVLGNAYITGKTLSSEATFPVIMGPDMSFNGSDDAFVAKVNAAGTALVYCGYVGGSNEDDGAGIAIDGSGNAYIIGSTKSPEATFPVVGGPDLTFNGLGYYGDAFVAKVNAAGSGLVYCGYIGGFGVDAGRGIAVDGAGNAYVTGYTFPSVVDAFPVTVGPDLSLNGGYDAFVAKVNASGSAFVYCGYIGGSGSDNGKGIAVDESGCAYVTGSTYSTEATFPVIAGPGLVHRGFNDAFVAKVNAAGTELVYCGYVGGSYDDYGGGIAVDKSGNAYVTGSTDSTEATFPVTVGPDLSLNGGTDAFVAKVKAAGTALVYCGYIGGSSSDHGLGIAVDGSANAYVTGITSSTEATFPATVGPDLTYNDTNRFEDAFVAKVCWIPSHAVGDLDHDLKDEVAVDFGTAGIWLYDQGNWTQLAPENPEGLLAVNLWNGIDLLADLGPLGLWGWDSNGRTWSLFSTANAEAMMSALAFGSGSAPSPAFVCDFGVIGLWQWTTQQGWEIKSGSDAEGIIAAGIDGPYSEWHIADFGDLGLWRTGGLPYNNAPPMQLSGENPDQLATGRLLSGAERLICDFGALGLWAYDISPLSTYGAWANLTGVNADFVIAADTNADGIDEVVGDFGAMGLWLRDDLQWTQLTGANPDHLISADVTGDGGDEIVVDLGSAGIWVWNNGPWSQISAMDPEYLLSADTNGDGAKEILADFGTSGLWMWNGAWTRISEDNPD